MGEPGIRPALTPEEWGVIANERPAGAAGEIWPTAQEYLAFAAGFNRPAREAAKHKLAALALHGQPYGFTWADVDLLEESARAIESEWGDVAYGTAGLRLGLLDLADRIAALLQPREEP